MNIIQELLSLFHKQLEHNKGSNRALVFWYDPNSSDRDIQSIETALENEGIRLWTLTEDNPFRTKVKFELEDTEHSYLLYAPFERPKNSENFLLDILLYGGKYGEFVADEMAIKMRELRIDHLPIRSFLKEHWSFFGNQKRVSRFEKLLPNIPTEDDVKRTMLAVLVGAPGINPPELLKGVVKSGSIQDDNEALLSVNKFMDSDMFFTVVEEYFGLPSTEDNRLRNIVESIVFQHFSMNVEEPYTGGLTYESSVPNICKVFIDDWLKSDQHESLAKVLNELQQKWNIEQLVQTHTYEPFIQCDTFKIIEETIVKTMHQLMMQDALPVREWRSILSERSRSYWYHTQFERMYLFMEEALNVYDLRESFKQTEVPQNGEEWFALYTEKQFQVDYRYRQMLRCYHAAQNEEFVSDLYEKLTYWYENEFLLKWSQWTDEIVTQELGVQWNIPSVLHQQDFFRKCIQPILEGTRERIFVIISDAMRYEIGYELKEGFANVLNAEVSLQAMQGVLPSYTQLGMAALLPGKITGILENGTVEVDGMSTKGMVNRTKVLQSKVADSIACDLIDFMQLNKEQGQELIRGKRVVFLYHNFIDAIGDDIKTEKHTYTSVEKEIEQLKTSVKKLTGTYEAVRIYMTSDHGFLYQSGKVEAYQKTERIEGEIYDRNRRFAIGRQLSSPEGTMRLSLNYLGVDREAVIAKGLNRFTAQGGQRFVHGGAMPQECIVPLLEYRQIRGKAKKTVEQRVDVRVASVTNSVTSYQINVPFFQEEKVNVEYSSRSLRMAFYFNGERISNEVNVTFDRTGEVKEREVQVTFHLFEGRYKTGDRCTLRMEDVSGKDTFLYKEEDFVLKLYSV